MLRLEPNESYFEALEEFLIENMDDGWGKPFDKFDPYDKVDVRNDFSKNAAKDFENYGKQKIRSKYGGAEFELERVFFDLVYNDINGDIVRVNFSEINFK
jgi:hypothetical protein